MKHLFHLKDRLGQEIDTGSLVKYNFICSKTSFGVFSICPERDLEILFFFFESCVIGHFQTLGWWSWWG